MINIEDSIIHNETKNIVDPVSKVFTTWDLLHENDKPSIDTSLCKTSKVEFEDISITLLFEHFPEDIMKSLPIPGHELYKFDEGLETFHDKFKDAIKIVNSHIDPYLRGIVNFSKVFTPVKLNAVSEEKLITSLTIPDLPFMSFLSENAFFHLAPDVVNHGFDSYYLAENIFHEMTHNYVNIMLLEQDILKEEYSSSNSLKVEIPWRKGAEVRNQYWELDRMIHAYFVYKNLILFRSSLSSIEGSGFSPKLVDAAIRNSDFLKHRILENKNILTEYGIDLIKKS